MPKFIYQAKKGPKELFRGEIEAASEAEALNLIASQGLYPVKIEQKRGSAKIRLPSEKIPQRISSAQLLDFSRQLHNLLCAHIELLKALYILREQSDEPLLRNLINSLHARVKDGENLSVAMAKFPQIFSQVYVNLIKAGEVSGKLDSVLGRIVTFLEERDDLRRKVISSLAYPIMMVLVGIATVVVLVTFVIPKLTALFSDFGQDLPLITKALLFVSSLFSRAEFWLAIAAAVIILAVYQRFSRNKLSWKKIISTVPFFRRIILMESITHFSFAFGMLLDSGVSVLEALGVSGLSLGDPRLAAEVNKLKQEVTKGLSLAEGADYLESFPKFFRRMLVIGEESGMLPAVMDTTTQVLRKELEMRLKIISSLIEPTVILAVGLVLGIMVVAMLLPVFQMSGLAL
ncbi:type II secretion system F family protein [Candidatus Omnitrophota bacterium]